jgi:hypothetical protein
MVFELCRVSSTLLSLAEKQKNLNNLPLCSKYTKARLWPTDRAYGDFFHQVAQLSIGGDCLVGSFGDCRLGGCVSEINEDE